MIYLHIGINKTGTSSVQNALYRNRNGLLGEGILYPETGLGTPNEGNGYHYFLSKNLGFVNLKSDPNECLAHAKSMRADLDREIAEHQPKHVIFSSEFFSLRRNMDPVRRFFDGLEVVVIVYLRRHDIWYPSLYSQALKTVENPPWEPGLEGFVRATMKSTGGYPMYSQLLNAWADLFGRDNVRVRAFERESMKDSITDDFFDLCGLSVPNCLGREQVPVLNKAPDATKLAALEELKRTPISALTKRLIVGAFWNSPDAGEKLKMSAELKQEIIDRHSEDYATIARQYLGDQAGVLFRQSL